LPFLAQEAQMKFLFLFTLSTVGSYPRLLEPLKFQALFQETSQSLEGCLAYKYKKK
jgi:hypothetical protein